MKVVKKVNIFSNISAHAYFALRCNSGKLLYHISYQKDVQTGIMSLSVSSKFTASFAYPRTRAT